MNDKAVWFQIIVSDLTAKDFDSNTNAKVDDILASYGTQSRLTKRLFVLKMCNC